MKFDWQLQLGLLVVEKKIELQWLNKISTDWLKICEAIKSRIVITESKCCPTGKELFTLYVHA
jgi:hypothetical protein